MYQNVDKKLFQIVTLSRISQTQGEMKARRRAAPRNRARRAPLGAWRRAPPRRKKPSRNRAKTPIIPLISRGGKPLSYFELLQEAVLTLKDADAGVSLPEIRRHLQRRYKSRFDKAGDKLLTTALQRLAERGKVICKRGYRYQFNAPKVSKANPKASDRSSYSGTSRSGATSGSAASDATSRTSGSYSESATSGTKDQAAEDGDAEPKDGDQKSSSDDDPSSSAPQSASSTASRRASSSKKR